MRYALRDILEIFAQPCQCGMPGIRFKIIGRADDMLIIKGVNVYPEAIKTAIFKFRPEVTGVFRILIDRPGPMVTPPLIIRLEYRLGLSEKDLPALETKMMSHFRRELRFGPQFEWVPPETFPRKTNKTKFILVKDERK